MTRCSVIKILPTNSMMHRPSWEPVSSSASHEITPFIEGQCSLLSSQQPGSCLFPRARSIQSRYSHFTSDSVYYYLNIRMRSSTWDHDFSPSNPLHTYRLPHICYSQPITFSVIGYHNNIWLIPQPHIGGIINQKTKWATGENSSECEKRQKCY
jgi:hypothetical protein